MKYNLIELKRDIKTKEFYLYHKIDDMDREERKNNLYPPKDSFFWYYPTNIYSEKEAKKLFIESHITHIKEILKEYEELLEKE